MNTAKFRYYPVPKNGNQVFEFSRQLTQSEASSLTPEIAQELGGIMVSDWDSNSFPIIVNNIFEAVSFHAQPHLNPTTGENPDDYA